MNIPEKSLHEIQLTLRRAAYRKEMREARRNHWLKHGGGQLFCYIYMPKYPKELLEVYDWRPIPIADPALRQAVTPIGEAEGSDAAGQ